jgi:hypothetical protein
MSRTIQPRAVRLDYIEEQNDLGAIGARVRNFLSCDEQELRFSDLEWGRTSFHDPARTLCGKRPLVRWRRVNAHARSRSGRRRWLVKLRTEARVALALLESIEQSEFVVGYRL